jgi:hypothetical protein
VCGGGDVGIVGLFVECHALGTEEDNGHRKSSYR